MVFIIHKELEKKDFRCLEQSKAVFKRALPGLGTWKFKRLPKTRQNMPDIQQASPHESHESESAAQVLLPTLQTRSARMVVLPFSTTEA